MLDGPIYTPPALYRPGEITITPWSMQSLGVALFTAGQTTPTTNNFVAVNLAIFVPFSVPEPVVITKLFWANGAAVAGNLDAGIYDPAGARLVSTGSTAQATVTNLQVIDTTNATLARGVYYLAFASDTSGVTQKVIASLPAAGIPQSFGLLQMAAAFPLPATATYAKYDSAFVPFFGAQGYRTFGP